MVAKQLRPRRRSPIPTLAALFGVAILALTALPVGADHPQSVTTANGTYTIQFDHGGDNEWWVEVYVRGLDGDFALTVSGIVEGGGGFSMTAVETEWDRTQQGWQKWAPNPQTPAHVPPGKRVMFEAAVLDDGTGNQAMVRSCWFTHPAGVEQCGTQPVPTDFQAPFTGFRGNEWWVQANVGTNGPAIAKVDVRSNNGAWMPLSKQSWGATAWGGSYHFTQGSILQMRATASDGRTDLSSCRQWIPASNTDAAIVACPSGGGSGGAFDATFSNVKGNDWWVQAGVSANQPLAGVDARVNCSGAWHVLTKQSYGYAASFNVPAGSKVDFRARSTTGATDLSGGYTWPAATPTSAC